MNAFRKFMLSLVLGAVMVLGPTFAHAYVTLFASAARTATANSSTHQVTATKPFYGKLFVLDISASGGTSPTLDINIQMLDPLSASWITLPGASFSQKTGTGSDTLLIGPGVTETANRKVDDVMVTSYRANAVIGGTSPTFTFTLIAIPMAEGQSFD